MTALARRLDDVLFGPESPARLRFVHAGLAVLIAVRIALGPYRQLATQPPALFRPVPFLEWLDGMPAVEVILALQAIGTAAAVLSLVSRHRRAAFVVAWLALLVLAGLRASRGKILHNDLLLLLASAPFLLAPIEPADRADRTPARRYGWPVRSALTLVSASYFLTGYWKLRNSGLSWVTSDNMRWILVRGPVTARPRFEEVALAVADSSWLSRGSAALILAFELSFPVVLVWAGIRPLFAAAAAGLHGLTFVLLGLDYWSYGAVALLLLVDWPQVWDRWRGHVERAPPEGPRARRAPHARFGRVP